MKYIDSEKLIAEIERLSFSNCKDFGNGKDLNESFGGCEAYKKVLSIIASLQQEQPNDIVVPLWCIKNIENTLGIQNNINLEKKTAETCQDRNIRGSINQIRKLLKGEELSGLERLEPLRKQPEVSIECGVRVYPKLDGKPRPWVSLYGWGISLVSFRDLPELESLGFKDDDTAIVTIARKEE